MLLVVPGLWRMHQHRGWAQVDVPHSHWSLENRSIEYSRAIGCLRAIEYVCLQHQGWAQDKVPHSHWSHEACIGTGCFRTVAYICYVVDELKISYCIPIAKDRLSPLAVSVFGQRITVIFNKECPRSLHASVLLSHSFIWRQAFPPQLSCRFLGDYFILLRNIFLLQSSFNGFKLFVCRTLWNIARHFFILTFKSFLSHRLKQKRSTLWSACSNIASRNTAISVALAPELFLGKRTNSSLMERWVNPLFFWAVLRKEDEQQPNGKVSHPSFLLTCSCGGERTVT